ncbi:enoyl-CoA hydratase-related protein [Aeromicrobium chenweiae]|uniref:Enoyl-CoA hydratase n=1 Tax=Aeromicrobium chenweiae TaxID=2079793 RepID=A0A2S0WPR5_9ACTN|nr:enoyl-CoA hydratase-related protein [Aeromicrobium chenweiae]AWB93234.1 enoyl-CoA hydratase [Aeromicrobium chenweiae]TGN34227.1 enoyl-CoA hydratase [Aeromicrobium chenweiae]
MTTVEELPELETLTLERADGVAVVTLSRPPVNAVNRAMQLELVAVFDALSQDRSVNSVVLAAAGEKAFCAGIDLRETAARMAVSEDAPIEATLDAGWEWRRAQAAIRHCSVPVIAAVEGPAIGAGFGLVGVCDLIIASESASFALTEINVGLLGGASKAIRMLGPFKARMMMFTGTFQSAADFHRLGAVEEVVAPGKALDRAREIGVLLASKSPLALRLAKESILRLEGDELEANYRTEQDYTTRLRTFEDSAEAMQAFIQKRDPVWAWR